ncbi:MAG: hypothetical protein AAFU38_16415 [Bacteroidota bacterium]
MRRRLSTLAAYALALLTLSLLHVAVLDDSALALAVPPPVVRTLRRTRRDLAGAAGTWLLTHSDRAEVACR